MRSLGGPKVAFLAALLVGGAACNGTEQTPSTTGRDATTTDPRPDVETSTTIFGDVTESAWVTLPDSGAILRLPIADPTASTQIEVGSAPAAVAVAGGLVWAASGREVLILDPGTAALAGTVDVGDQPATLVAGAGVVWAVMTGPSRVVPVSEDGPGDAIEVPDATAFVGTESSLWVIGAEIAVEIDESGSTTTLAIDPSIDPIAAAVDAASVYLLDADGTVFVVDARAGEVVETFETGVVSASAAAFAAGSIWITDRGSVASFTPQGTPGPVVETGVSADGLAVGSGALWVISAVGRTVTLVETDDLATTIVELESEPGGVAAA